GPGVLARCLHPRHAHPFAPQFSVGRPGAAFALPCPARPGAVGGVPPLHPSKEAPMKRLLTALGAAVLVFAIGQPAAAQEAGKAADAGETVSITAQVVDLSCKIVNDASGEGHQACATACAEKGQPLGLLTSDGQFYVPVNAGMGADGENARLKAFAE